MKINASITEIPIDNEMQDFQTVAENSPDVICRFDQRYAHLYVNPALEKVTGVPQHMWLGKTPHELGLPVEFADYWVKHLKFVFSTSQQTTYEFTFPSEEGERYFQSLLVPEFDARGRVRSVLSVSRDITEMKREEKRKEEMVGMVSHELKTPVTSLKAFAQILHKQFVMEGDTQTASHFAQIDSQLSNLASLINDLHEATKIENKTMKLHEEDFVFADLVKEVVEHVQRTSETHKIQIKRGLKKKIYADKRRISQVLTNLLSNAIKYSPDANEVVVQWKFMDTYVLCSIEDFGIGIPKDKQELVFERFFRITGQSNAIFPGLGLGLFITAEIIKLHKGQIWVESTEGKGSTFYFTLPLGKE